MTHAGGDIPQSAIPFDLSTVLCIDTISVASIQHNVQELLALVDVDLVPSILAAIGVE